jgi:formylglycine-generating enzyme required for sulfatase activity
MGSPLTEAGRKDDEKPHAVMFSSGFYMSKTPVTVGDWKHFVEATGYKSEAEKGTSGGFGWDGKALVQKPTYTWKNPGFVQTNDHPVTIITYDDALEFTRWATRVSHRNVTLPTEAQWEYAYRAGTTSAYYDATAKDALGLGWFKENAGAGTKPVGQKKPNAWGLVDMGGNVWQWCLDWYAPYPDGESTDPQQEVADTSDKARRVLRGGSWLKDARNGRAAARYRSAPGTRNADTGFRLVVLDRAPVVEAPIQSPADPGQTEPLSSPMPPATDSGGSSFVNLFFRFVPTTLLVAVFVWIFAVRKKNAKIAQSGANGIALRPDKDGYWINANPNHIGSRITVQFTAMYVKHVSSATIERADSGQFVYTGHTPTSLRLVQCIPAAQPYRSNGGGYQSTRNQGSSWNSSNAVDSYSTSNNHSHNYNHNHNHFHSSNDSYSNNDSSSSNDSFQGYPPAY